MQISDIYTLFKCHKDQNVLAENLQNTLMMISGLRDEANEIQNDDGNNKWMLAGIYEKETGLFYFREGEHTCIQNHFRPMHISRLHHKKSNSQAKKVDQQETFGPKILPKSKQLAEAYRTKHMHSHSVSGLPKVDVV